MSRISAKDTKPELLVRKFLFSKGFRYRLHVKQLPGSPDIILPKFKTAIFINGCFWHGHVNCKYFTIPKSNSAWWEEKIGKNKTRDELNIRNLTDRGWDVVIIHGCELKTKTVGSTLSALLDLLQSKRR